MEELKKLRQEYHDNPCLETRFCSSLHSNFLRKRKDTHESKQKARMWQKKIDEKITLPFIKS